MLVYGADKTRIGTRKLRPILVITHQLERCHLMSALLVKLRLLNVVILAKSCVEKTAIFATIW